MNMRDRRKLLKGKVHNREQLRGGTKKVVKIGPNALQGKSTR